MTRTRQDVGLDVAGAIREVGGLVQVLRLVAHAGRIVRAPQGTGGAVVVIPGHRFGDRTTIVLRSVLRLKGHAAAGWGLGSNDRQARLVVGPLSRRIEASGAAPVALVGQSLGGFVAREVARNRPDLISTVITLGSPLYGATSARPLTRPIVALWSARDQVVPPHRARSDDDAVEHVEVRSSHFAMGLDPDVIVEILHRLDPAAGSPDVIESAVG